MQYTNKGYRLHFGESFGEFSSSLHIKDIPDRIVVDFGTIMFHDECTTLPFNQELFNHVHQPIVTHGIIKKINDEWTEDCYVFYCNHCGTATIWDAFPLGRNNKVHWDFYCSQCSTHIFKDKEEESWDENTLTIFCQEITVTDEENRITLNCIIRANKWIFSKKDYDKSVELVGLLYKDEDDALHTRQLKMINPIVHLDEHTEVEDATYESGNREDVPSTWRKNILARDKKCIVCGGEKHLVAHHIFGYKLYPQLRADENNGITLCQFCHDNYHSQYGVKNPNPVSFVQFIRKFR